MIGSNLGAKPAVHTVELKMHSTLLVGSKNTYGMRRDIVTDEEVDEAF